MLWGSFYTAYAMFIITLIYFPTSEVFFRMLFCSRSFNGHQQTGTLLYGYFCNQCTSFSEKYDGILEHRLLYCKSMLFKIWYAVLSDEFIPLFRVILETLAPT